LTNETCAAGHTPQPGRQAAIDRLAAELRKIHGEAGDPSLRTLQRRITERASADRQVELVSFSTLGRVLRGDAYARWPVVDAILVACGVSPATYDTTRQHWLEMANVVKPIASTAAVAPSVETAVVRPVDIVEARMHRRRSS
jgi:hypothetical protein